MGQREEAPLGFLADGDGRVMGADATKFFAMSDLSRADLKQVWAICDSKRQGFLGFGEFVATMQLVSLAQAGNEINQDSLKREDLTSSDTPVMKGLDELLATSMATVNVARPEKNGTSQVQAPVTNNWFRSKSAKKMQSCAVPVAGRSSCWSSTRSARLCNREMRLNAPNASTSPSIALQELLHGT